MRIVAVADLHGRLPVIPECDVLVIAGDICPDIEYRYGGGDPGLNAKNQLDWLREDYAKWEETVPAKRILATPGNHDWVQYFPANCRSEMFIDAPAEHEGKKFWFTPWVSPCGAWNYQLPRDQRKMHFDDMPYKLDLLVMHSPARDVGDLAYGDVPAGCHELRAAIQQKQPRYAVFGHIHEGQRYGKQFRLGGSKVYHASMWGMDWKPVEIEI